MFSGRSKFLSLCKHSISGQVLHNNVLKSKFLFRKYVLISLEKEVSEMNNNFKLFNFIFNDNEFTCQ